MLSYHQLTTELFKKSPDTWSFFSNHTTKSEHIRQYKLELLKNTYKFDEAVQDGVVLDLLYEARDVDQHVLDQKGIDDWFEAVTYGMNDLPKAELKQKWGTMQKVLSTKNRLEKVAFDIINMRQFSTTVP